MRAEIQPVAPGAADAVAIAYYGRPLPAPWFGIASVVHGVVVGVGGIIWLERGPCIFMDCARRYMPSPLASHRWAMRLIRTARAAGEGVIYGIPAPGEATSKKWFAALGFAPDSREGDVEVWACRG